MKDAIQKQDWALTHYGKRTNFYCWVVSKGKHYSCKVDSSDLDMLKKHRWYFKDGYAVTSIKSKRVKMHHLVMGKPPQGKEIDHINRDRIDNRRHNLRFVTSLINGQNTSAVGVRKHGKLWEANVCLNYQKFYKSFETKSSATFWRNSLKSSFIDHLAEGKDAESFFADLLKTN